MSLFLVDNEAEERLNNELQQIQQNMKKLIAEYNSAAVSLKKISEDFKNLEEKRVNSVIVSILFFSESWIPPSLNRESL